jgi:glycosyltransferase involved in cell wall biosynthesis
MAPLGRLNVLVLESSLIFGGVENLLFNVFTRLDSLRFRVTFCTLYDHGPMGPQFIEHGCRLEHSLIRRKFDPRAFIRLRRIIRRDRIDVIYLVTQPLTLFWGFLVAKACGLPLVCLVGNTLEIRAHPKLRLYRFLLPLVDAVVAQADTQGRHLAETQHIPGRLIRVVPNGVDPSPFERPVNRSAKLQSLGLPADALVVGSTGRMVRLKGIDVLLRAFRRLTDSETKLHLVLVGTGPDRDSFEESASAMGIRDRVHFLGHRQDLPEIVQLYDVAVLSSRSEAFPMVLLEYMAAGRPVVATKVGSVADVLSHEVHGLLVEPENSEQLASAISRVLSEPESAKRRAENARARLMQKFTIQQTVRNTESLLADVLRRKRNRQ